MIVAIIIAIMLDRIAEKQKNKKTDYGIKVYTTEWVKKNGKT